MMWHHQVHARIEAWTSTWTILPAAALGTYLVYRSVASAPETYPVPSPANSQVFSHLSNEEKTDLAYPPDVAPGARDVDSPYGRIRVYEWGPEDGDKVLLIHGISTPCVALLSLAHSFVQQGKRVMLFDLFGRGYSDAAEPPYDLRLYTSQILLVLTSSPLHWSHFSIVGYSLGGCIGAGFSSYFPYLVDSFIAVAPAGLLRTAERSSWLRILYSDTVQYIMPSAIRTWILRRRLWTIPETPSPNAAAATVNPSADTDDTPAKTSSTDVDTPTSTLKSSYVPFTPRRCALATNFSLTHHPGFPTAFISSLAHAPIYAQQALWRRIQCPILLILGAKDPIIKSGPTTEDFEECVPSSRRQIVTLEAGHEVPISRWRECADTVQDFWDNFGIGESHRTIV